MGPNWSHWKKKWRTKIYIDCQWLQFLAREKRTFWSRDRSNKKSFKINDIYEYWWNQVESVQQQQPQSPFTERETEKEMKPFHVSMRVLLFYIESKWSVEAEVAKRRRASMRYSANPSNAVTDSWKFSGWKARQLCSVECLFHLDLRRINKWRRGDNAECVCVCVGKLLCFNQRPHCLSAILREILVGKSCEILATFDE